MDLSKEVSLIDSDKLIDYEHHFKLFAGPGSGKTRFLINHIENVLHNSSRLSKVKKIACITYTNIGVKTIIKRLVNSSEDVEVSTIHSFLYKHVLKPYLWILNDEYQIPLSMVNGHDEVFPTYSILKEWKLRTDQQRISDNKALTNALISLRWFLLSDGSIELKFKYPSDGNVQGYYIRKSSFIDYKKICWQRGLISHDDVLFLSYTILKKETRILDILRAKFPYIFVDEFQDTNPIQSVILQMIAEKETIVGVIGDMGQSIFSFQGADVRKFIDFTLDGIKLYKIEGNHRSTNQIINILNHMRGEIDFFQNSPKNKDGPLPKILIGGVFDAYKKAVELSGKNNVCSLAYRNDLSNLMKFGFKDYFDSESINEPIFKDSSRGGMISYVITSIEYCRQNKINDAVKYMKKAYRKIEGFEDREALLNLKRLINDYDLYCSTNIMEFYNNYIFGVYGVKQKISSGPLKEYYQSLEYKSIATSVRINDDDSFHRTIHKAKGDEFENVLLIIKPEGQFEEEKHLDFLFNPNINKEENRVYYVALSRAKINLFINIPWISKQGKEFLANIKFEIIDI